MEEINLTKWEKEWLLVIGTLIVLGLSWIENKI